MRVKKRHFISLRIYIDYGYLIFQVQLTKKRSSSPSKDLVLLLIQMKQTSCCPSKSSEGWKLSSSWSIFLSFIHTVISEKLQDAKFVKGISGKDIEVFTYQK